MLIGEVLQIGHTDMPVLVGKGTVRIGSPEDFAMGARALRRLAAGRVTGVDASDPFAPPDITGAGTSTPATARLAKTRAKPLEPHHSRNLSANILVGSSIFRHPALVPARARAPSSDSAASSVRSRARGIRFTGRRM